MRPPANKTAVIDFPTTYIVTISPVYVLHSLCQLYIFILLRNIIEIKNRHSEISPKEQQQQNYEGHKSLTE